MDRGVTTFEPSKTHLFGRRYSMLGRVAELDPILISEHQLAQVNHNFDEI